MTDSYANKEILLVCLRYIDLLTEKPVILETFLDSIHVQGRPTGKVIGTHIWNILDKHQINLEHCRAQVYYWARAMPSSNKGASAIVKENNQKPIMFIAEFIVFSCRKWSCYQFHGWFVISMLFFCQLTKTSAVFEKFTDFHKKDLKVCESNRTHIIGLSNTRWVDWFKACNN